MSVNWFGLEAHPTDAMIHWSVKDQSAKAVPLRAAYDDIVAAGHQSQLEILLAATYQAALDDIHEDQAGEDI